MELVYMKDIIASIEETYGSDYASNNESDNIFGELEDDLMSD